MTTSLSKALRLFVLGFSTVLAAGCASANVPGPYVWASQLALESERGPYRVQPGDMLSVQVWDNVALSVKSRVRSDGRFTIPLIGDVNVAGDTPEVIASNVQSQLSNNKIVLNPRVTVMVDEDVTVSVLGKVTRAGSYPLLSARGVADALAAAGGLTEFAHRDQIYVLRRVPQPQRIRFRFGALFDQNDPSSRFRLRSGDVVLVD